MPIELVHVINQQGFHFDSPILQDSFNIALHVSQMILHMGHIGQNFNAF